MNLVKNFYFEYKLRGLYFEYKLRVLIIVKL